MMQKRIKSRKLVAFVPRRQSDTMLKTFVFRRKWEAGFLEATLGYKERIQMNKNLAECSTLAPEFMTTLLSLEKHPRHILEQYEPFNRKFI